MAGLRTQNLIKSFRSRKVVNRVSIEVKQGEIVGLLGPNGAGKTTTFYMIVGLIRPSSGHVYLDGDDMTNHPMYVRAQKGIGYLAQEASVFRKLSVEDNIKAVLEMTNLSLNDQHLKLEELLSEFGLEHIRSTRGDLLSGGERRRTEIARALAVSPKFILLDEPFAGVDPIAVEDIQSIVCELKKKNIPFYSVSAIFRKEQLFFQQKWFAKQLNNVSHFFVQNQESKELLQNISLSSCTVSGDTRFDTVITNTKNAISIPLIKQFSKNKTTIICGSTWLKDEIILVKYIKDHPENNYIIAPHELQNICDLKKQTNALLYSMADDKNIFITNVLIIDSIGILSSIYQYANIAYIGGGFGSGIHNILEAVTFGLPVVFGPNYQKFIEANELINQNGAISISNYKELYSAINAFTDFDQKIATNYIKNHSGATKIILETL